MDNSVIVSLRDIVVEFDGQRILDGLNLDIRDKEFVTLLGPSGCGKTTTLRLIAGFLEPNAGQVLLKGQDITGVPPYKRPVNTVFQKYALFPHLNVFENVAFGLRLKKMDEETIRRKVRNMLEVVGLKGFERRSISQMSGGQQQRVAIARTLAPEPSVLFMDEPLSNLDAKLRLEMRYELQRLHVETGSTFVYVTHDQMEAMTLATQICLINNGVLQQYEPPLDVYHRPANLFVADFVGNPSINFVEARGAQRADGAVELTVFDSVKALFKPAEQLDLKAWFAKRDAAAAEREQARRRASEQKGYVEKSNKDETFRYHVSKVNEEDFSIQDDPVLTNEDLVLGIRPEFIEITGSGGLEGEIYGAMPTGMESTIKVRVGDYLLTGVVFGSTLFKLGTRVRMDISSRNIMLFDRRSGECIALGGLEFREQ